MTGKDRIPPEVWGERSCIVCGEEAVNARRQVIEKPSKNNGREFEAGLMYFTCVQHGQLNIDLLTNGPLP